MIITLDAFKGFLGVDVADTSKDAYYSSVLQTAEDYIASFFGGNLLQADYIEMFVNTDATVYPTHYPITQVLSVFGDGMDITSYCIYDKFTIFLPGKYSNLTIQYTAGFTEVPSSIQTAIILKGYAIVKIQNDVNPNKTYDERIENMIKSLLEPYLRGVI
jgi:hypothetical protein